MIFHLNEAHCHTFLEILEHVIKTDRIEVHAYCLMGNHYHLLLRTPQANLVDAMHRLGSMFTKRVNRAEKSDGPIFRGRYRSKIVGHDDYLRQLCRYIHHNPVAAGIAHSPKEYKWSSYRAYIFANESKPWLTVDELPKYFDGPNPMETMRQFVENSEPTQADSLNLEQLLRGSSDQIFAFSNGCTAVTSPLKPVSLREVVKIVSFQYNIDATIMLLSRRGIKNHPRDVALYLSRKEACMKINEVAKAFSISRTAASTVISRLNKRMQIEEALNTEINILISKIRASRMPLEKEW